MRQMIAVGTRGRSRMRESCTYGSVRGALSNERPYRNMQRRSFLTLLGGAAAAWPLAARAQQAVPVVGYLGLQAATGNGATQSEAFRRGLSEAGYMAGRNVAIEYRWAENQYDRYPVLVADILRHRINVIYANGPAGVRAVRAVNPDVPIVFTMGEDPVKEGVVTSLSRPGGNSTGFTDFSNQLTSKRMGLLRDTVPKATVLALLVNPTHPNAATDIREAQTVAAAMGRVVKVVNASSQGEIDSAFATWWNSKRVHCL
jgi:putative ABC transport system substrate-binding protein